MGLMGTGADLSFGDGLVSEFWIGLELGTKAGCWGWSAIRRVLELGSGAGHLSWALGRGTGAGLLSGY